jgi:hypothetical protein
VPAPASGRRPVGTSSSSPGPSSPAPSPRSRRCEDCTIYACDELGFVSALIARSAAGLIASAVTIPDLEAVSLMRSLHQFLLRGATLAEALHAARATIDRTDRRAFVNWCAFTAFGAA